MLRWKRLLLLLLVAVAVPLQGAQAAADHICMAFGHHDAPSQFAHHDDVLAGSTAADPAADAEQGDAHCGPCVSCCGAASIASSTLQRMPVVAGPWIGTHYVQPAAGMLSGVLDRPPLAL